MKSFIPLSNTNINVYMYAKYIAKIERAQFIVSLSVHTQLRVFINARIVLQVPGRHSAMMWMMMMTRLYFHVVAVVCMLFLPSTYITLHRIGQGQGHRSNKKLRYREEHSASVVRLICLGGVLYDIGRQTTDQQLINHLYETGHETYRIPRNNAK